MQVKSKQRVADFGEVYTNEREVNAMLDLVADQTTSPEKTFLEPACGTGNFLSAILARKLDTVAKKYKRSQFYYELFAVVSVGSLYGIELLRDNVEECKKRLSEQFSQHYQRLFPKSYKAQCCRVVDFILDRNIICGDALTLKTADGRDIVFSQWISSGAATMQRKDFIYRKLVNQEKQIENLNGKAFEFFVPLKEYPLTHFLELSND